MDQILSFYLSSHFCSHISILLSFSFLFFLNLFTWLLPKNILFLWSFFPPLSLCNPPFWWMNLNFFLEELGWGSSIDLLTLMRLFTWVSFCKLTFTKKSFAFFLQGFSCFSIISPFHTDTHESESLHQLLLRFHFHSVPFFLVFYYIRMWLGSGGTTCAVLFCTNLFIVVLGPHIRERVFG